MRVCLFTPVFLPTLGGIGIVVHQLASFLSEEGHDVTVIVHKRRGENPPRDLPYRVFRFRRPFSQRFGVEHMIVYLTWEKLVRGFDILHCHSAYPHGYIGSIFKKLFKTPLVITSHGDIMKGSRARDDARLAKRVRTAMESANAVTALSHCMKEESIHLGAREQVIDLIPNAVDLREFQSEEKFVFKTPYIFSMGILRKVKGFDVLLEAFERVKTRHPDISLLIGGEGKERGRLEKLVSDLNLKERVHFLGAVSGKQKISLLKGCEFYVCAAIAEEPFSNSTLEAFAAGKAVVASHVGGVPDLVEEGRTGRLVPPANPAVLAEKMIELLHHPALVQALSNQALVKSKVFDVKLVMRNYLNVYRRLLNPL
jgi:glycosyltransferase involved in cell wall biosynthesis